MAILFTDVEYVMCSGEFVHDADGIFVAGIRELSSVQNTDDSDVVAFNAAVNGQALVGAGFFFVVVNVCVAGIPVVFLGVIPAVEGDFDVSAAMFRHFDHRTYRFVFCAAFDQNVGAPTGSPNLEFSVAKEERGAGASLEHGLAWIGKMAIGCQYVNFGADLLAGRTVNNMSVQDAHR